MSKPEAIRANQFWLFADLLLAMQNAMREGHTVTTYLHQWGGESGYGRGPQFDIEFEVCIKKINGEAMPRITQRRLQKAKEAK